MRELYHTPVQTTEQKHNQQDISEVFLAHFTSLRDKSYACSLEQRHSDLLSLYIDQQSVFVPATSASQEVSNKMCRRSLTGQRTSSEANSSLIFARRLATSFRPNPG